MEQEVQTGVYCIINTASGRRYVGSAARSFRERWNDHRKRLRKGEHSNIHLQRSWDKNGEHAFTFVVVERCPPLDCLAREQYWIDAHQAMDGRLGYNICPTAGSPLGRKMSEAARAANSAARKGSRLSEETKRKIGDAHKGRRLSPEHIAKVAASNRGKKRSQEFCAQLAVRMRGTRHSDETRAKMSASRRGIRHSAESRAKIAAAKTGTSRPDTAKANRERVWTEEMREKLRAAWARRKQRNRPTQCEATPCPAP